METNNQTPKILSEMQTDINNQIGLTPTYHQFYKTFIELHREKHPNSTLPSDLMLSMFYDDYIKAGEIIGY